MSDNNEILLFYLVVKKDREKNIVEWWIKDPNVKRPLYRFKKRKTAIKWFNTNNFNRDTGEAILMAHSIGGRFAEKYSRNLGVKDSRSVLVKSGMEENANNVVHKKPAIKTNKKKAAIVNTNILSSFFIIMMVIVSLSTMILTIIDVVVRFGLSSTRANNNIANILLDVIYALVVVLVLMLIVFFIKKINLKDISEKGKYEKSKK